MPRSLRKCPGRITDGFWQSLAAIDHYRRAFKRNPESLANAILLGSLLIPLGLLDQHHGRTKELGARFGMLPLARRDVEFLRQILMLQRHLRDPHASPRHKRGIMHRTAFPAALMWLELHGNAPELVESWRALQAEAPTQGPEGAADCPPTLDCRGAGGGAAGAGGIHLAEERLAVDATQLVDFVRWSCRDARARSAISSLMIGQDGSISLGRKLNFGLRGCPWWLL